MECGEVASNLDPIGKALDEKNACAFVLGAGSSKGAIDDLNMPDWEELLGELLVGAGITGIKVDPNNYLETAGLVEDEIYNLTKQKWENYLHESGKYFPEDAIEFFAQRGAIERVSQYVKHIMSKAKEGKPCKISIDGSLNTIAEKCKKRLEAGKKTVVITYNYENIFEYILREKIKGVETLKNRIRVYSYATRRTELSDAMEAIVNSEGATVDILYVHGRIDFLKCEDYQIHEDGIVLSRQSYDKLFRAALEFTNQIQYLIFSSMPTLAIGFSCDDPNFRRLMIDLKRTGGKLPKFYALKYCGKDSVCDPENCADLDKMNTECQIAAYYGVKFIPAHKNNYNDYLKQILKIS